MHPVCSVHHEYSVDSTKLREGQVPHHAPHTHTLIEFPIPAAGHGWVISPIYFGYVVAFNVGQFIHCQVSSKRNLVTVKEKDPSSHSPAVDYHHQQKLGSNLYVWVKPQPVRLRAFLNIRINFVSTAEVSKKIRVPLSLVSVSPGLCWAQEGARQIGQRTEKGLHVGFLSRWFSDIAWR